VFLELRPQLHHYHTLGIRMQSAPAHQDSFRQRVPCPENIHHMHNVRLLTANASCRIGTTGIFTLSSSPSSLLALAKSNIDFSSASLPEDFPLTFKVCSQMKS
jgi:hypothetical protein